MPQSTYAALNGREIREILKKKVCDEIDKIPLLKLGNSFHRAELDFGFTMKAFPTDVPVPEKEFTVVADSGSINNPDAIRQIDKANELEEQLNLIRKNIEKFEETLQTGEECLAEIRKDTEFIDHVDGSIPDQARIDSNLDVPVVDMKNGKRIETTLPAGMFIRQPTSTVQTEES